MWKLGGGGKSDEGNHSRLAAAGAAVHAGLCSPTPLPPPPTLSLASPLLGQALKRGFLNKKR